MAEQKESRLNEFLENPERSLWSIAIPVIAGMAIQTFYSIVDMLFIGQLGGSSIAAVAFNMPLYFFVMGITFGVGTGITATIARAIGEENKEKAEEAIALAGNALGEVKQMREALDEFKTESVTKETVVSIVTAA